MLNNISVKITEFIETRLFLAPHSSHPCLCVHSHKASLKRNKNSSVLKITKSWKSSSYYKEASKIIDQI